MVEKLEKGESDLTERVDVKGENEVARMGRCINAFVENLQNTVGIIRSQSLELDKTVAEMTKNVQNSNENAAGVSGVMQELSARMQEISATISQVTIGTAFIKRQDPAASEKAQIE